MDTAYIAAAYATADAFQTGKRRVSFLAYFRLLQACHDRMAAAVARGEDPKEIYARADAQKAQAKEDGHDSDGGGGGAAASTADRKSHSATATGDLGGSRRPPTPPISAAGFFGRGGSGGSSSSSDDEAAPHPPRRTRSNSPKFFRDDSGAGAAATGAAVKPTEDLPLGLNRLNPAEIAFSQFTAGTHFSDGSRVDSTIKGLQDGSIQVNDISPIRIVKYEGLYVTLDNRRLLAFNTAGITEIPVIVVSMDAAGIAEEFRRKFKPVDGDGVYTVVAPRKERQKVLETLMHHNKIEEKQHGL